MVGPDAKGLLRGVLCGRGSCIRDVFEKLAVDPKGRPRQVNTRWNISYTRVDLPPEEGSGCWKLFAISDEIYLIVTDCNYYTPRLENVPAEGLVEFHYVLEGPVELELPRPGDMNLSATTMMACHQAPGVSYDVACLPGRFRMISLYAQPTLLIDSFAFGRQPGTAAALLLHPSPQSMAMFEVTTTVELVDALRALFQLAFTERSDLLMAVAKVFELLSHSASLLEAPQNSHKKGVAFSERELAMFASVRQWLSSDEDANLTISDLARRAGTNSTKLKTGFKLLYGMTIFDYRHRYRMNRAVELLADPSIQIAAVATLLGYRHQASFTTACKEHFGISPKELRKLAMSGAAFPAGPWLDATSASIHQTQGSQHNEQ
ncbi:MAG: hypothetical protein RLZZ444_3791 [Pseudomonadota bacterium]|jgi:AraC-like DNA-binding protein